VVVLEGFHAGLEICELLGDGGMPVCGVLEMRREDVGGIADGVGELNVERFLMADAEFEITDGLRGAHDDPFQERWKGKQGKRARGGRGSYAGIRRFASRSNSARVATA